MKFRSVDQAIEFWLQHNGTRGERAHWPNFDRPFVVTGKNRADEHVLAAVAIDNAMRRLTERQRSLVLSHYVKDLGILQIAARLRKSKSRAYAILSGARRTLAVHLRKEGVI